MASGNQQLASTALIVAAWTVALYLVSKAIPGIGQRLQRGYTPGLVPVGNPFPSLYNGVLGYDGQAFSASQQPLTPRAILNSPILSSDLSTASIQALQTVNNAGLGLNIDGSSYTPAQQQALAIQYDDPGDLIPYQQTATLPDSDYPVFDPGTTGVSSGDGGLQVNESANAVNDNIQDPDVND